MIWDSIVVGRTLTDDQLRHGVATAFGSNVNTVYVYHEINSVPYPQGWSAACQVFMQQGDFPIEFELYLNVYYAHELSNEPTRENVLKRLACAWDAACMASFNTREDPNPYTMLLAEPGGALVDVLLDADMFDDHGHYKILRANRRD